MSLEGRLRELALAEVLQLLSLGKKTGTLRLRATLIGRDASIVVESGWIVDATESGTHEITGAGDVRTISDRVLDILQWTDGDFHFTPHVLSESASTARIPTDVLLMESARRADAWISLRETIPGAHAVPAFPDVQPAKLPLLHLSPDQWEILTRIDGTRSINDLARDLRRDLVDVAMTLHALIEAGVLTLVSADQPPHLSAHRSTLSSTQSSTHRSTLPAPPVVQALHDAASVAAAPMPKAKATMSAPRSRQTIPPVYSPVMPFALPFDSGDDDSLFDPMQVGVMTPDGMPATSNNDVQDEFVSRAARSVTQTLRRGVPGTKPADTISRERLDATASELLACGDRAAATGNLTQACSFWEQSLAMAAGQDAHNIRERIMLARRLESLLHSSIHSSIHSSLETSLHSVPPSPPSPTQD